MKRYICKEVPTESGGYLEIEKELIECRDCRFFINKECASYCLTCPPANAYCYYAEPKDKS